MKKGIVDVGGGLRGVYAAGVLDYCLDVGLRFDLGIGVSAGSANLFSFIAGQRGRNYPFYTEYPFRKEYMSIRNYLFKKSYLDLDYIYGTLSNSNGENPLDYPKFMANPMEFFAVATNAETGEVKYFSKADVRQDEYSILKASCAIPFICHPYAVNGVPYYDGALGDAVPIEKAFTWGCDKVVLILTKPVDVLRVPGKDIDFAKRIRKKYPKSAERLRARADQYNRGVELAKVYEAQGKLCIVSPDNTCGVDTLTKDRDALRRFYQKGFDDGKKVSNFFTRVRQAGK